MHRYYFTLHSSSSLTINLRTIRIFSRIIKSYLFPRFFHEIGYSALLHHKIGLTIIDTRVYTYQQAFITIFKSRFWRIYFKRNEMIALFSLPLSLFF